MAVCGGLKYVEQGEEDAAEGGFAAGGVVPLLEGVDAAALATAADGDGRNAAGERDVCVGRAEAWFGAQGEVTVDGAEGLEERRVVGKCRSGTVADGFDMEFRRWGRGSFCRVRSDDLLEDAMDGRGGVVELVGIGGADIQQRGG